MGAPECKTPLCRRNRAGAMRRSRSFDLDADGRFDRKCRFALICEVHGRHELLNSRLWQERLGERAVPDALKGLCRTHYARLRRTGSALTQRRPGRAKDQERAVVLASFPEWSARTQAMYWKAFCRLRQLGEMQGSGDKPLQLATQESARSNGSLNVRKFDAMSIHLCAAYIEELTRSSTRNS